MKFDRNSWTFLAAVQTVMAAIIAVLLMGMAMVLPGDLAAWLGGVLLLFGPMLIIAYRVLSNGYADGIGDSTHLSWEERAYLAQQTQAFVPVQLLMIGLWIGVVGEHPFLPATLLFLFVLCTMRDPQFDWGRLLRSALTIASGVIVGHWLRVAVLQW